MRFPPRSYVTIQELSVRWAALPYVIIGWAIDGHFSLAAAFPPARVDGRVLSGVMHIAPVDVFSLFRPKGRSATAMIRRVQETPGAEWLWISEPAEGIGIATADVLVPWADVAQFEARYGLAAGNIPKRKGGPGAPARYDWDRFFIALCKRIHNEGLPPTQADLIKTMQDWFDDSFGPDNTPDESTIRRKVQAIWKELH